MFPRCLFVVSCLLAAGLAVTAADNTAFTPRAYDWPQWQGPDRTAVVRETGLLKSWPKEGPPLVWRAKGLGGGFSAPSVAAGRVFGMSFRGGDEVVWALEEASGKELWCQRIAAAAKVGHGSGPRCTPTVDGDRVYGLGVSGDLACLDVATGKVRWQKNLQKDFGGRMMSGWGYSESPLVDGDRLICTPGQKSATLVALDKMTGATVWSSQVPQGDPAAYASVIAADVDGRRQYVQFLNNGVVGVSAADGKFLWRYDKPANRTANATTPIYHDGHVFAASAYGKGGGLIKLTPQGEAYKADEVYFTKSMKNHHGGVVLLDGYLYGANGGNGERGKLVCLDFRTGQVMWEQDGKGSLASAEGLLYYRLEDGPMLLVEANPKKYVERGRFNPPDRSRLRAWPHPVLANGRLYLRDQDVLLVYDVKERTR